MLIDEIREALRLAWRHGAYSDEVALAMYALASKMSNRDYFALMGMLDDIETWRAEVPTWVVDAAPEATAVARVTVVR